MRKLLAAIASALALGSAHAEPSSPASVEQLFVVMRAESMMDSLYGIMEQAMRQGMQQAARGRSLTPSQQETLETWPPKFMAVIRDQVSWAKVKPVNVQIYCDTFEQDEVDGMLAFYGSPAGQALVTKMPIVLQKSTAATQALMQDFMPKMMWALQQAIDEAGAQK